ncbi:hypothetical protein [Enterococcus faecium]|uniref:hypothetical protein n=1 Tax=Enterococcus faecium TaxID=1352 RepID=UPI003C6D9FE6
MSTVELNQKTIEKYIREQEADDRFFYYSTLFDSRFKTLQQNLGLPLLKHKNKYYLI